MGLLKHNTNERPKMEHGGNFEVKNQVSRDEVVKGFEPVTYATNVRVDNHVRNKLTALVNVRPEKNIRELAETMITMMLDQMSEGDQKSYEQMFRILEEKDALKAKM